MDEKQTPVTEITENMEQTTEQTVEQAAEQPAKFTQEQVDGMIKEKLDQILPGKIARREANIRKEYDRNYGELMGMLKAGTGKETVEEITETFRQHYAKSGITVPQQAAYSEKDIAVLAQAEAKDIIGGGYEEVVAETDRLAKLGTAKMTPREKALFTELAKHRQAEERVRELTKLGVTPEVYNSKGFQDFVSMFSVSVPIGDIYSIYEKTQPKKNVQTMGSMKQGQTSGAKDFYTPEEIERISEEELDDPKVWEAVRRSMTGG